MRGCDAAAAILGAWLISAAMTGYLVRPANRQSPPARAHPTDRNRT
jgi:hypothetical protein